MRIGAVYAQACFPRSVSELKIRSAVSSLSVVMPCRLRGTYPRLESTTNFQNVGNYLPVATG